MRVQLRIRGRVVAAITSLSLAVVMVSATAASSQAAVAPCGSDALAAHAFDINLAKSTDLRLIDGPYADPALIKALQIGKQVQYVIPNSVSGGAVPIIDPTARVTFSWQSAGGQFTYPASRDVKPDYSPIFESDKVAPLPLQLADTDGPGKLVVTRPIDDSGYEPVVGYVNRVCQVTYESAPISRVFKPIKLRGNKPESGGDMFWEVNTKDCSKQVVKVVVSRAGHHIGFESDPGCVWKKADGKRLSGLWMEPSETEYDEDTAELSDAGGVGTVYDGPLRKKRRFHYEATVDGSVIRKGSFTYTTRIAKGKKTKLIWDYQFDDYVNICINKNRKIRAKHGHLYCVRGHGYAPERYGVVVNSS